MTKLPASYLAQQLHLLLDKHLPLGRVGSFHSLWSVLPSELVLPVQAYLESAAATINTWAANCQAWEVSLATAFLLFSAWSLLSLISTAIAGVREDGWKVSAFNALRRLPFIAASLRKEKAKMKEGILAARDAGSDKAGGREVLLALPATGTPADKLLRAVWARAASDAQLEERRSKVSGAVYIGGSEHKRLLDEVFCLYSLANPLHADVFPSLRHMEAEVVAMTAEMLGGSSACRTGGSSGGSRTGLWRQGQGAADTNGHSHIHSNGGSSRNGGDGCVDGYGYAKGSSVCGAMTSGGSESILSAMKASRDYMRVTRGVRRPEMIVANSAHAAYWKAAEYFKIKLIVVPVGLDLRLSAAQVARHMTRNTAIIVASAPGFPHGVIDDIEGIAKIARRAHVCLHVDACLGGFLLPFVRRLGYPVQPFDFSVPGVTSMSADVHKFGMSHKGTSVVLYSSPDIRRHQYTSVTDWTGGLYISPGMAGSRPGALIATAWTSMVHFGVDGYTAMAKRIMDAATTFKEGLSSIPELQLLGEPDMSVVAFKAADPKALNIYKLNDLMTRKGWHLNALQVPDLLLTDLRAAIAQLRADPTCVGEGGSAPVYGLSNVSPDRGLVAEFLIAYQDVMLQP